MNQSNNQPKDSLSAYRAIKALELTLVFIVEIVYLLILIFNKALRTAVFTNKLLFSLCLMMWIALIISFVCMLIDFNMLKNAASENSELSHTAYVDSLTGLPNRLSVDLMISMHNSESTMNRIGVTVLKLTNLVAINDRFSHEVGDSLIQDFCIILKDVGTAYGFVGRNGGNEFLGIFEECDDDLIVQFISDMYVAINLYNMSHVETPIEIEYAYALNDNEHVSRLADLLMVTYRKLEEDPLT
ncbi:MAG: GGDEF domain-containing protein [Lachnospiraceae bacterium]|nr:GGDEF domain-containing protein [Lachnospiraceae bacterium]